LTAARIQQRVIAEGDLVLQRLQQTGLIRPDIDLLWARRAYHGLLDAAISPDETETDPDLLAARIVDTLLHGLGLPAARPAGPSRRALGWIRADRHPGQADRDWPGRGVGRPGDQGQVVVARRDLG
jgi:hypothetical protein